MVRECRVQALGVHRGSCPRVPHPHIHPHPHPLHTLSLHLRHTPSLYLHHTSSLLLHYTPHNHRLLLYIPHQESRSEEGADYYCKLAQSPVLAPVLVPVLVHDREMLQSELLFYPSSKTL